jgi:hypothetical protein
VEASAKTVSLSSAETHGDAADAKATEPKATLRARLLDSGRYLFGSPSHDRLVGEIEAIRADIEHDLANAGTMVVMPPWAGSACNSLRRASELLKRWEIENAWDAVHAARRFQMSNPDNPLRLENEAVALRLEAEKVPGWRGKTMLKLLGNEADKVIGNPDHQLKIIEAMRHRDNSSQNTWFKIMLRRRHLLRLFTFAWTAVIACLSLSAVGCFTLYLGSFNQVLMAALFGAMGSVVSVAKDLVADTVSARIPAQQIGAFVVWMRPGLGAAAALVVVAGWKANVDAQVLQGVAKQPSIAVGLAFLAGFSEHLLVGSLDRISRDSDFRDSKMSRSA